MLCANCAHYGVCINRIIDNAYECDEGVADLRMFKRLAEINTNQKWFDKIMLECSDEQLRITFFKDDNYINDKIVSLKDFSKSSLQL